MSLLNKQHLKYHHNNHSNKFVGNQFLLLDK